METVVTSEINDSMRQILISSCVNEQISVPSTFLAPMKLRPFGLIKTTRSAVHVMDVVFNCFQLDKTIDQVHSSKDILSRVLKITYNNEEILRRVNTQYLQDIIAERRVRDINCTCQMTDSVRCKTSNMVHHIGEKIVSLINSNWNTVNGRKLEIIDRPKYRQEETGRKKSKLRKSK